MPIRFFTHEEAEQIANKLNNEDGEFEYSTEPINDDTAVITVNAENGVFVEFY